MSIWDKLRGKNKRTETVSHDATVISQPTKIETRAAEPEKEIEDVFDELTRAGSPGGPSVEDALATFRKMRSTSEEGAALEALSLAFGRASSDHALPEALVVAAASALVDRGEPARAIPLLDNAKSPSALLLLSDLEADRGDVPRALSLVERVLLRELDHPGALERHRRHRAALGLVEGRKVETEQNTVVAAEPDSPYRLLREVARGGAGAVYEAEDRELGRKLALKVYHEATRDRDQLLHEVRVAVALAGPGVVRIFDVDPDHGWIALEWAPLGALRERIRARDRASLFPIESWLVPFTQALARVHDAGLVHLDVKPANILMLKKEMPVLADFGIARRAGEASPPGSMGYVSPERLAKKPADFSDDVYALGRVVEDVLDALGEESDHARFRELVAICTGPAASRPRAHELPLGRRSL